MVAGAALFVILASLASIVFLGEFLVSKEFRVHALGGHIPLSLGLLDSIGMCLVRVIVRTCVLLLHHFSSSVLEVQIAALRIPR